jgi:hypothetical protein
VVAVTYSDVLRSVLLMFYEAAHTDGMLSIIRYYLLLCRHDVKHKLLHIINKLNSSIGMSL